VAHELSRRGYRVTVYETNAEPGGFFRSARARDAGNLPTEYSWHGLGPWYHNVFDLMKQIPFDETGSVFDRALSRPVDYGIAPDHPVLWVSTEGHYSQPPFGEVTVMT